MLNVILTSTIAGVIGTMLGGCIAVFFCADNNKTMSGLLSFASGIMIAVVAFELIPTAIVGNGWQLTCMAVLVGALLILLLDTSIKSKYKESKNPLRNTGIILAIAIGLHNLPEGFAIGTSEIVDKSIMMSILIGLHNIPEGIAMAAPLHAFGLKWYKIIGMTGLAGLPTVIGAIIGFIVGGLVPWLVTIFLAVAGGSMAYIVFKEMLPQANILNKGDVNAVVVIVGLLVGIAIVNIL